MLRVVIPWREIRNDLRERRREREGRITGERERIREGKIERDKGFKGKVTVVKLCP